MEKIRREPLLLKAFLQEMPKGGDLHAHLEGSVYAETFIRLAAQDGLCIGRTDFTLADSPCDQSRGSLPVSNALQNPAFYSEIVNAFSMRDWTPGRDSGQDHFFFAFPKFSRVARMHPAELMAEVVARSAAGRLQYLELMHALDRGQATQLGRKLGWDDNLENLRERLLAGGLSNIVSSTRRLLEETESQVQALLKCGSPQADPGCEVTVRHIYAAFRGFAPEEVFAQLLLGFELWNAGSRYVGINMVMPEHWYVPMRDFKLHMQMVAFLHRLYPKVHITLHAGELAPGQVPPDGLRFHIRESIARGSAERIGHGAAVMSEREPIDLLQEMAKRKVLVEICLTSNDFILGVRGPNHPLPLYLQYGVPVALATDDQGVSRSGITEEFFRAADTYKLPYKTLKRMARQSLEHSFLPASERAQMQRNLEQAFARFERKY